MHGVVKGWRFILCTLAQIYTNSASTRTILQAQEVEYRIGKEALQQQLCNGSPDMMVFSAHLIAPVI